MSIWLSVVLSFLVILLSGLAIRENIKDYKPAWAALNGFLVGVALMWIVGCFTLVGAMHDLEALRQELKQLQERLPAKQNST